MQRLGLSAVLLALALVSTGCSQQTQREAGEALEQAGESLESAGEDAANVIEGAVEGASDAVDENQAQPDTELPQ